MKNIIVGIFLTSFIIVNYLNANSCSIDDYHHLKGEYNFDVISSEDNSFKELQNYRAELFASSHIYDIDSVRDIGEEFHFGKNNVAKLLEYEVDNNSGFNAGVYLINNKRIIIAFGGTTAKEKYTTKWEFWKDAIKTDILLLKDSDPAGQVKSAINFTHRMQIKYSKYPITATGHSLGGGLAQFSSLSSKNYGDYHKIKSVTFNTAPAPLTVATKKWIGNDKEVENAIKWAENNNINFMTNNDPLTLLLRFIENREKFGDTLNDTFSLPEDFSIDLAYIKLKKLINTSSETVSKLIYGKRIFIYTNSGWAKGHLLLSLFKKVFPKYNNFYGFRNGFDDVPQPIYTINNDNSYYKSDLYCSVLSLMQNHSISYPKQERDYKFYPNQEATNYEFSIFIVNTFYYGEFRKKKNKYHSLTRFQFFKDKFDLDIRNAYKFATTSEEIVANVFKHIYQELVKYTLLSLSQIPQHYYDEIIKRAIENISFVLPIIGISRGQIANHIFNIKNLKYNKLVIDIYNDIKSEEGLRYGPGSLRFDKPILFLNDRVNMNYHFK